jgi:DNA-binding SARP family transcriptional activator
MALRIHLFGAFRAVAGSRSLGERDFGGRKSKQLLEIVALRKGRYVHKDQLCELLWGEHPPADPASTLDHYASLIRRRLKPAGLASTLVTGHGGYRIDTEYTWIDVVAVDVLLATIGRSNDRAAIAHAVELLRGDLVEDEPHAEWALTAREYYRRHRIDLLLAGAHAALGEYDVPSAAEYAAQAVLADPYHEAAYRILMTAHYASGNQQAALRAFHECRRRLAEEIGVDPTPATLALHQAVLDQVALDDLMPSRSRIRITAMPRASVTNVAVATVPQPAPPADSTAVPWSGDLPVLRVRCDPGGSSDRLGELLHRGTPFLIEFDGLGASIVANGAIPDDPLSTLPEPVEETGVPEGGAPGAEG